MKIKAVWLANALIVMAWCRLDASIQMPSDSCPLRPVESHAVYQFVAPEAVDVLRRQQTSACAWIREGTPETRQRRWSMASQAMDARILRKGYCRGTEVNPQPLQQWDRSPSSKAVNQVFTTFCQNAGAPNISLENLVDRARWLRTEVFCQVTRYFVVPGGWRGLLKPDAPSWQRLAETSSSLCTALRSRQLAYGEAVYRWTQERLWVQEHLPNEIGVKAASGLVASLKDAVEIVPKVLGLLPK